MKNPSGVPEVEDQSKVLPEHEYQDISDEDYSNLRREEYRRKPQQQTPPWPG